MYKKTYFFKLSLCTLLISCSTSKDKFFNKRYHNLNSKYNVIFNAEQALNFGEQLIKENPEQDFGKIIDVDRKSLIRTQKISGIKFHIS